MRRIQGYELERELARGGFGAVYRARELATGRPVALKLLLHGAGTPQHRRFRREAEALARLSHPNLVRVHAVGEAEGTPYMVMELLEGRSLAAHLEGGPLPPQQAAAWASQLASALAHAHARGVLHRDLKPGNVLVTPDGRAVLVDFGLTKDLAAGPEVSQLTRTGHALGTLGYLPPEQARGDRAAMGPASDVYGLGATLYAALTGEPPHAGTTLVELLSASLQPVVPPSELEPRVDAELERVCLACLVVDPARRPSAAEVAARLERWSQGERRPARVKTIAGVGLTLALILLALAWGRRGRAPAPPPAPTSPASLAASSPPASAAPPPATSPTPAPDVATSPADAAPPGPARPADGRYLRCVEAWGERRGQALSFVRALALAEDRLLSAGGDGLRWWDAETGAPLGALDPAPAQGLAVSPAGRLAISGGADGVVRLWDLTRGEPTHTLGTAPDLIEAAAFDPSGTRALIGCRGKTASLQVWGAVRGTRLAAIDVPGGVFGAEFLDAERVITSNGGGVIQAWDLTSGEALWRVQAGNGAGFGVSISPDRRTLLTTTWQDKKLALWSLAGETPTLLGEEDLGRGAMRVANLGERRMVVYGGAGMRAWGDWGSSPPPSPTAPRELSLQGTIWALAVRPDGKRLWLGSNGGQLSAFDTGNKHWLWERRGHLGRVHAVFECPQGVASVGEDLTLRVWTPGGGEQLTLRLVVEHSLDVVAVSPEGVAVGGSASGMYASQLLPGADAPAGRMVVPYARGMKALALAGPDAGVVVDSDDRLFTFSGSEPKRVVGNPLEGHEGGVLCVGVAPSGPLAVSGGQDGTVRLWDRDRRQLVQTFRGHAQPVRGVAFRGERPELLSVGEDGTLRRWDLASGSCAATLQAGSARGVVTDPQGRLAATWDADRLRLWDLDRDAELEPVDLGPLGDRPTAAAFTADGQHLLVGSQLGVVYRFELRGLRRR